MPPATETIDSIAVCLVADEDVVERFPGFVRYLQIGLLDEPIDFFLVAPDHPRTADLVTGSTRLIRYRRMPSVFRGIAQRLIVKDVYRSLSFAVNKRALLVHSLSLSAAPLASQIARATGSDLILNVASRAALNDPALLHYFSQAAELVAPVRAIERAIQQSSLADKAAETVPFGVAAGATTAAFREPPHVPTLLTAGPLEPESGFDTLLRAAAQVSRMHPELILFIVGKGSAESDLRRLARSLGIGSSVTFTGRIEHSRSAFSAGDIFCVPRTIPFFREEPIQALADGLLLVIANDTIFDGLEHRRNAILVPPGEVDALAESISTALSDREGARQIAAAGQLHIRMNHTISGMVGRYQKIYERLASPKRTFQIGSN